MRSFFLSLVLLFLIFPLASVSAGEQGWVASIPHAISSEHIYKVRIVAVDGDRRNHAVRHPARAGIRTITVSLMLDIEWEPDLSESRLLPPEKQMELEVETGKTYLLAGRVNLDAPIEAQLDQSYWEPFVYRVE